MQRRRVASITALTLSMASITPVAAYAASSGAAYYVAGNDPSCTDSGPGTEAAPFCTVSEAAAVATSPGDTVLIGPGTYSGEVKITASGTAADPITFEAVSGAQGVTLSTSASTDAYGLYLDGASYVDVAGLTISGTTGSTHSVGIQDSSHITLDRFILAQNLVLTGSSGDDTVSRGWILGGSRSDYTDAGIDVDSTGTGDVITTNIVALQDNGSAGVTVDGSSGAAVVSNTITGFCGAGIAVGDGSGAAESGATIENNVLEDAVTDANDEGACAAATTAGISVRSAADESGLTADYNDVYPADSIATEAYDWAGTGYQSAAALEAGTGQGAADSNANPEVVETDGLVENESSPVINAADSNAPGELGTDYAGKARVFDPNVPETGAGAPGYDRGAYQFVEELDAGNPAVPATAPAGATVTMQAPTPTDDWANATYTYKYDFGDGSADVTSTAASVTHTFASTGSYTVTVTVTSDYGADADTTAGISILKPVAFTASMTTGAAYGLEVVPTFSVTTDWPITSETIDYGDGTGTVTLDDETNIDHFYAQPGTYTVTYTVTDAGGDSKTLADSFTTAGSDYTPINAFRLLDTRKGLGGTSGQLADDGSIKLRIAGVDGIPSDVSAVDLNLTAADATGPGFIQADTGSNTGTSNLNYGKTLIYSNTVIARVASDGTVTLRNTGITKSVKTDLIADVTGYFSTSRADRFALVTPARLMDTRSGRGAAKTPLAPGRTDVLAVEGAGGLPSSGVAAVSVNLTVTDTTRQGFVVLYADGAPIPGTSDVDWQGTTTRAADVLVPVGADGRIDIYNPKGNAGSTDVIIDVTGYFTAATGGDVYVPVNPAREMDTRSSTPIAAGIGRDLTLGGADGMPAPLPERPTVDGYVLNATVTQTEQRGWLLLSDGESGTGTSTLNWTGTDQTVANLAIARAQLNNLIDDGTYLVQVYNGSPAKPVQAVVDVMGYFIGS